MIAYVFAGDLKVSCRKIVEIAEGAGECHLSTSRKHPEYLLFQVSGSKFVVSAEFEVCEDFHTNIPIPHIANLLRAVEELPEDEVLKFSIKSE
jgi:hypothetical protein